MDGVLKTTKGPLAPELRSLFPLLLVLAGGIRGDG